jgi:bifunctional DNA-binding transcriptional regulator/antitoxin component of YhaV-PrlF toxin-antitoxin module
MSLIRYVEVEGRIVLPKEIREIHRINPNTELIFRAEGNHLVISIRKNYCAFCGSVKDTLIFKARKVCRSCVNVARTEAKPVQKLNEVPYEELLSPKVREYHELIMSHPGIKQHEVAKILGVSQARVSKMHRKLIEKRGF